MANEKRLIDAVKVDLMLLRELLYEWMEWQDAKSWAKEYHPGWVHIARKARRKTTRRIYRDKIIRAYKGEDDG